jgi:tRNA dimethylallyltransferase
MLKAGWIEEVRGLIDRGYGTARAMRSVGYRQVSDAIAGGDFDGNTLAQAVVRATRVFARRQRTWLRDEPVEWVKPDEFEQFVAALKP